MISLRITEAGFTDIENNEIRRDVERTQNVIENEITTLNNTVHDFAIWDETYSYIQNGDKAYITENLRDSAFTKLRVNYILFVNNSGKIVFGKSFDLKNGGEVPFPKNLQKDLAENRLLTNHSNIEKSISGVMLFPDGPMIISSWPILTSERKGPVRGTLIMARSLDNFKIRQFAEITKLSLVLYKIGDEQMPLDIRKAGISLSEETPIIVKQLSNNIIAGYALFKDIFGKPVLILRVDQPRTVYKQSLFTIHHLIVSLLIIAVIFAFVAILLMEKFVLHRLVKLSRDVKQVASAGNFSERVSAAGSDELSNLSYDINGMLEKLEELEIFKDETNEARYRAVVEDQTELIFRYLPDGKITFSNNACCRYFGMQKDKVAGLNIMSLIPEECVAFNKRIASFNIESSGSARECQVHKNNEIHWLQITDRTIYDRKGKIIEFQSVGRDITEHKQAEEKLRQSEERYRSIFENAQEGIFRLTPDRRKVIIANQAMANVFGYESPEGGINNIKDIVRQHYVDPEDSRKVTEIIEEHGFVKGYEFQLYKKDRSIIWVSLTMQAVRDEKGKIIYYEGIITDITERKKPIERMRRALGATVQAMAMSVEARDPYTAGHQRRVATLARSIAVEMNLPADQIDGIRTAAIIHDLGKIAIPSEILNKPTKLTQLEVNFIRIHSQLGYDILKDIEFPWPVADVVLQHHERMDGSGYPKGLKGDNILLEARILTVADVVEAMASHRPYRPSLSIEAALKEIKKNKGILYDDIVADACLRLFSEKGYQLT
jgi:PAS domain S-box-containing protein/putative nucleotidyltransferase with HDIG domain